MNNIHPNVIWRAHVPGDSGQPELTVFVEALDYEGAAEKMAAVCKQLRWLTSVPADELFYNLNSGRDLIDCGVSADEALRLFETAWRGTEVAGWVEHPVFVVSNPRPLFDVWSRRQPMTEPAER